MTDGNTTNQHSRRKFLEIFGRDIKRGAIFGGAAALPGVSGHEFPMPQQYVPQTREAEALPRVLSADLYRYLLHKASGEIAVAESQLPKQFSLFKPHEKQDLNITLVPSYTGRAASLRVQKDGYSIELPFTAQLFDLAVTSRRQVEGKARTPLPLLEVLKDLNAQHGKPVIDEDDREVTIMQGLCDTWQEMLKQPFNPEQRPSAPALVQSYNGLINGTYTFILDDPRAHLSTPPHMPGGNNIGGIR